MRNLKHCILTALVSCLALGLAASPVLAESRNLSKVPGYVDGSVFVDLVGDDDVTVEVSIHGALLKALASVDPDLKELVGDLESLHAVVLELQDGSSIDRIRERMREMEKNLLGRGWERLARVRDDDSEVKVLVLNDEEAILGLVVLVAGDEDEVIFANVAGRVNLAAIAKIGESFNVPGLDEINGE